MTEEFQLTIVQNRLFISFEVILQLKLIYIQDFTKATLYSLSNYFSNMVHLFNFQQPSDVSLYAFLKYS